MDKSKCLSVKTKKIGNLHTRQISYFCYSNEIN